MEELRVGDYASNRKKYLGPSAPSFGAGFGAFSSAPTFGAPSVPVFGATASTPPKCPTSGHPMVVSSDYQFPESAGTAKTVNDREETCQGNIVGSLARCSRLLAEPSSDGSDALRSPVVELQLVAPLKVKVAPPATKSDDGLVLPSSGEATSVSAQSAPVQHRGSDPFGLWWQERKVVFSQWCTYRSKHKCAPNCKAYYELELLTNVVSTQFGFCNSRMSCNLWGSGTDGTGDCRDSWAVDGSRQCKWHHGKHEWPVDIWKPGDVIGLACDLQHGQLWCSINGSFSAPYGAVFSGLSTSDIHDGLFASFSARTGEVRYNFGEAGSAPFKHAPPDASFRPFAACPMEAVNTETSPESRKTVTARRGAGGKKSTSRPGAKAGANAASALAAASSVFTSAFGGGDYAATNMEGEEQATGACSRHSYL